MERKTTERSEASRELLEAVEEIGREMAAEREASHDRQDRPDDEHKRQWLSRPY